jgi:hypothetical protein
MLTELPTYLIESLLEIESYMNTGLKNANLDSYIDILINKNNFSTQNTTEQILHISFLYKNALIKVQKI